MVSVNFDDYQTCPCVWRRWTGEHGCTEADPDCDDCNGDGLVLIADMVAREKARLARAQQLKEDA